MASVHPLSADRERQERAATARWRSAFLSHVGEVRAVNEDSYLDRPDRGLWAVADGMGGHDAGGFASATVVATLQRAAMPEALDDRIDRAAAALRSAHRRIWRTSRRRRAIIGSTVVALLAEGSRCACCWAGDSRLYRLRRGALAPLTRDHTEFEDLLDRDLVRREAAPEHAASEVLTRAVGTQPVLELDVERFDAHEGDVMLLCSDGLTKELDDAEIATILSSPSPPGAIARALVGRALQRGAGDNVAVGVVCYDGSGARSAPSRYPAVSSGGPSLRR